MHIVPIAMRRDNYAYCLNDGQQAIIVDPSDAQPIENYLREHQLKLTAIWCTHHHEDHVGGVKGLLRNRRVPVYGSRYDGEHRRIPGQSVALSQGDAVEAFGRRFIALTTPGHTMGALCYYGEQAVFTGDTLFLAGCGRMFEGTPALMVESLNKIAALPKETAVYCGHEYTLSNLRFAAHVEPQNPHVADRIAELLSQGNIACSVPGTLALELQTNPFLRLQEKAVRDFATQNSEDESEAIFFALRKAKDRFR